MQLQPGAYINLLRRATERSAGDVRAQRRLLATLQETIRLQTCHVSRLEQDHAAGRPVTPLLVDANRFMGDCLTFLLHHDAALQRYRRALELAPDDPEVQLQVARALCECRRFAEAVRLLMRLHEKRPHDPVPLSFLGNALAAQGNLEGAEEFLRAALARNAEDASALSGLAIVLYDLGRREESQGFLVRALEKVPHDPTLLFARGAFHLAEGRYREAWGDYEGRWLQLGFTPWLNVDRPRWNGEPLGGLRLLVCAEQGSGDIIQFMRLVDGLRWAGATVLLACDASMMNLLRRCRGVADAVDIRDLLHLVDDIDAWVPLASLPRLLDVTPDSLPGAIPYIHPEPRRVSEWRDRLAHLDGRLKVGLVWAGTPGHTRDNFRSIPAPLFDRLGTVSGVHFISLQVGPGKREKVGLSRIHLIDPTPDLADWDDTAALVANLDLVITVDTSVAHLAGAMGRPVWTLIATVPDWRWMNEGRDTFWYPTMRLYRQPRGETWDAVLDEVRSDLAALASRSPTPTSREV